jgi:transposase
MHVQSDSERRIDRAVAEYRFRRRLSGKGAVMSGRVGSLAVMGARFIGGDREQVFLMPPSVRDWVPEGHLVWTVLDAVAELDLSAFYADYRADGHGRPAYEPSMMVALLLYAYARGNRSSRGIERACIEDVAYRVVAGNVAPDHSTIAEFRCRHERALGEVFSGVLGLCARAGLASVGVVAIDGTKMSANASINANRDFGQIAREILADAAETDRREDELYGRERGDELPEHLRTREGRRKALREAKERLERERGEAPTQDDDAAPVAVELDPQHFVTRPEGRRARNQRSEVRILSGASHRDPAGPGGAEIEQ